MRGARSGRGLSKVACSGDMTIFLTHNEGWLWQRPAVAGAAAVSRTRDNTGGRYVPSKLWSSRASDTLAARARRLGLCGRCIAFSERREGRWVPADRQRIESWMRNVAGSNLFA